MKLPSHVTAAQSNWIKASQTQSNLVKPQTGSNRIKPAGWSVLRLLTSAATRDGAPEEAAQDSDGFYAVRGFPLDAWRSAHVLILNT
jgi:hypothetical protein